MAMRQVARSDITSSPPSCSPAPTRHDFFRISHTVSSLTIFCDNAGATSGVSPRPFPQREIFAFDSISEFSSYGRSSL